MKPILITAAPPAKSAPLDQKVNWLLDFAAEVIRCSKIDAMKTAQSYTVSHLPATPVRTLNASTATTAQVADVLGQFLADLSAAPNNR